MSTAEQPSDEASPTKATSPAASTPKTQRVLACVLCQQRKVKCDRRFPCAHCVRSNAKCVPATLLPRQRRRRYPEKDLLDRLNRYENLLRQNHIDFDPLHVDADKPSPRRDSKGHSSPGDTNSDGAGARTEQSPRGSVSTRTEPIYHPKSFWSVMNSKSRDRNDESDEDDYDDNATHDYTPEAMVKKAWHQAWEFHDHLLFGPRDMSIQLSTLHPNQVHIFRLWQIYLENVNPMLKITHTPTLQTRIIDAASDLENISPTLEALMFSIYCISIMSIPSAECHALFKSSKADILSTYRFGCQQALLNCGILRSNDRECLTAFYVYLMSIRANTDPHSLSSMLGIAVRLAQRVGIHNEAINAKHNALEAEMRRRLWWSLIIFDYRIGEMSDYKTDTMGPTWDCRVPANLNDFDLRSETKALPSIHQSPTESIFAVVRGEICDFVRHSSFHLDFTNPCLKSLARESQYGSSSEADQIVALSRTIEEKYLQHCNPENPLHYMTIWATRGFLARCRLTEYYSQFAGSPGSASRVQADKAVSHAIEMLECDSNLISSPICKGFHWMVYFYFPFFAYMHICQDLAKEPLHQRAGHCWTAMTDNFQNHYYNMGKEEDDNPSLKLFSPGVNEFFNFFATIVLTAWRARENAFARMNQPLEPPFIVSYMQSRVMQNAQNAQATQNAAGDTDITNPTSGSNNSDSDNNNGNDGGNNMAMNNNDDLSSMIMPLDIGNHPHPYSRYNMNMGMNMGMNPGMNMNTNMNTNTNMNMGFNPHTTTGPSGIFDIPGQPIMDIDMISFDWTTVDWPFNAKFPR